MRIIDTFSRVLRLSVPFSLEEWEEYADGIVPGLKQEALRDSRAYDFETQIRPVVEAALAETKKQAEAHASFLDVTARLPERYEEVFGEKVDIDIVFYLGLCNGAGWVIEINGRSSVLLGLEKIMECGWCSRTDMTGLVYHEIGHIWHFGRIGFDRDREIKTNREDAAVRLYIEGTAMYAEQLLLGAETYHQDDGMWWNWCRSNDTVLCAEYLRRMESNESVQDFYGDWCRVMGHPDTGYYLGCRFVRWLAERESLAGLASLSLPQVTERAVEFLRRQANKKSKAGKERLHVFY